MPPRIAIPMPHSTDPEYSERAIPQYERAVRLAGGEPVRIPLDQTTAEVVRIIANCAAVLLPGSKADVDPAKFNAARSPHTAAPDSLRNTVDELLLQDAYNARKPILGICYGLQTLNVFRGGALIQHIPGFLPEDLRSLINHEAGREVPIAHNVEIEKDSTLAQILCGGSGPFDKLSASAAGANKLSVPVNSSHHQSADAIGRGLRLVACCPDDGIIEGLEGSESDHFVIAVQWHPERSVDDDEPSRALFRAFVSAAAN
jgi:putative glutamine amidotransferase